jgi:hypothetical protein
VKALPAIRRTFWHLLFSASRHRVLERVYVRTFLPDSAKVATIDAKTSEAFVLLRDFGARYLTRIRELTDGESKRYAIALRQHSPAGYLARAI